MKALFSLLIVPVLFFSSQSDPAGNIVSNEFAQAIFEARWDAECDVTIVPDAWCSNSFTTPGEVACEGLTCDVIIEASWSGDCNYRHLVGYVKQEGTLIATVGGEGSGSYFDSFTAEEGEVFDIYIDTLIGKSTGDSPGCSTMFLSASI